MSTPVGGPVLGACANTARNENSPCPRAWRRGRRTSPRPGLGRSAVTYSWPRGLLTICGFPGGWSRRAIRTVEAGTGSAQLVLLATAWGGGGGRKAYPKHTVPQAQVSESAPGRTTSAHVHRHEGVRSRGVHRRVPAGHSFPRAATCLDGPGSSPAKPGVGDLQHLLAGGDEGGAVHMREGLQHANRFLRAWRQARTSTGDDERT